MQIYGLYEVYFWKFEVIPSSSLGGDVWIRFWLCLTGYALYSKFLSYAKIGTLRNSSWNFELNPLSHYRGVVCPFFWAASYWPCPTDRLRSKFLSDTKLGTLRNISWNFELNPSSHYRGVVWTKFWPCLTDRVWSNFFHMTFSKLVSLN